jgi:hypothetical protein
MSTVSSTNSMGHSPLSQANGRSASQEIHHLFWDLKIHYRVHMVLSLDPILSYMNPMHNFTPYLRSILILCLHLHLHLTCGLFSQDFRLKFGIIRTIFCAHLVIIWSRKNLSQRAQIMMDIIIQFSLLSFISSLFGSNNLLTTFFWNTHNLYVLHLGRGTKLHTHV